MPSVNVQKSLLHHVLYDNPCTDPDCELHNAKVAMAEGVISGVDLAYYIAGMQCDRKGEVLDLARNFYDELLGEENNGNSSKMS